MAARRKYVRKVKKITKFRFKGRKVALQHTKQYQNPHGLVLHKEAFRQLVQQITRDMGRNLCFGSGALRALQEAAECMVEAELTMANHSAIDNKRVTLQVKDMRFAELMRLGMMGLSIPGEK